MSDPITQAVQAQYEAFPYPPVPSTEPVRGFSSHCSYGMGSYRRNRRLVTTQGKTALVAGCGTGWELHQVAVTNPGLSQIVGFDLSHKSIDLARDRIRHHGLAYASVQVGNLMDPESIPAGTFDLISAYGVLHHTADPAKALHHLASRLAPDGILGVMIYNRAGRMIIYRIRKALDMLGIRQLPQEQQIEFIKTFLASAQPEAAMLHGHAKGNRAYYQYVENIVDNFLHEQDIPYDIAEISDYLAQAGLKFLDVAPTENYWQVDQIISTSNLDFYQRYHQLSRLEQLTLLEQLNPTAQTQNVFWATPIGSPDPEPSFDQPFDAEFVQGSRWQLNPLLVEHGILGVGDKQIPLRKLCLEPESELISMHRLSLTWSPIPNPRHQIAITRKQLQTLLLPMGDAPVAGEVLLQGLDPQDAAHGVDLLRQWESLWMVMRA
ncbi:MAG: class I SAM-dependent methyltransferase [Synechococcaceae cyanobacterium SM2_3_2]|nr:class I SAM-dependent methyltransferase [Synechococcaceae cyanobacterium SM2_3_2]